MAEMYQRDASTCIREILSWVWNCRITGMALFQANHVSPSEVGVPSDCGITRGLAHLTTQELHWSPFPSGNCGHAPKSKLISPDLVQSLHVNDYRRNNTRDRMETISEPQFVTSIFWKMTNDDYAISERFHRGRTREPRSHRIRWWLRTSGTSWKVGFRRAGDVKSKSSETLNGKCQIIDPTCRLQWSADYVGSFWPRQIYKGRFRVQLIAKSIDCGCLNPGIAQDACWAAGVHTQRVANSIPSRALTIIIGPSGCPCHPLALVLD